MRFRLTVLAAASVLCLSATESPAFLFLFGNDAPPQQRGRAATRSSRTTPPVRGVEPDGWARLPFWGGSAYEAPSAGRRPYYTNEGFESSPRHVRPSHRYGRSPVPAQTDIGSRMPAQPASKVEEVAGELVIALQPGVPAAEGARLARRHRLALLWSKDIGLLGQTVLLGKVSVQSVADARTAIAADPRVASVQPNHVYRLTGPAAPDAGAARYAADKMHLAEAHRVSTGAGALVAVIDTAVDGGHPELAGQVTEVIDTVEKAKGPGVHGTAMAGVIASHTKLAGVAPAARILSLRALRKRRWVGVRRLHRQHPPGPRRSALTRCPHREHEFRGPADPLLSARWPLVATDR